jgi:DNA topoisomerase-3
MKRSDVDTIINGCDAGREGELIFVYIDDWARVDKPVQRLWVSSMTGSRNPGRLHSPQARP